MDTLSRKKNFHREKENNMANITIYDIAKESGLSIATVSRYQNNKVVSDKSRQAIMKAIEKHNYTPNAAAQSLAAGARVLGIMVNDIRNPYLASLSAACEIAANKQGYSVLLCNLFDNRNLELKHLDKLYAQRVEAIIQLGLSTDALVSDPSYVDKVKRLIRKTPFVTSGKLDGVRSYSVNLDHIMAVNIMFDYLTSLGHRKIAFVGGKFFNQSAYDKKNEYIRLMKSRSITFPAEFIQEKGYDEETGFECMQRLFKLKTRPSAIMAISDECAIGVIHAARNHGLSVPEDLSVIGYDNTFLAEVARPRLTSVDCNIPHYGAILVDVAIRAARDEKPSRKIILDTRLVTRESCGKAPGYNKAKK